MCISMEHLCDDLLNPHKLLPTIDEWQDMNSNQQECLKKIMEKKGLGKESIGRLLGVSGTAVRRWASDGHGIPYSKMPYIAWYTLLSLIGIDAHRKFKK